MVATSRVLFSWETLKTNVATCVYSEGVSSHSPGSRAERATLGQTIGGLYPNGITSLIAPMTKPFQGRCLHLQLDPRVAAMRGYPGLCDETPSE